MVNSRPYQDRDTLRQLYVEQDLTQEEIAEQFPVGDSTISNWIRRHDLTKEKFPWRDEGVLRELYWGRNLTIEEVAEELETDAATIHRWMDRLDVDRRPGPNTERPWWDEDRLRRLYQEEGLSQSEIAERLGTDQNRISEWMRRFGIETETWYEAAAEHNRVEWAFFYTSQAGYELSGCRVGDTTVMVQVHRLVAIAEYGFDEVRGKVIHHRNGIPWDNRPENLEVMTDSEHKRLHAMEHLSGR